MGKGAAHSEAEADKGKRAVLDAGLLQTARERHPKTSSRRTSLSLQLAAPLPCLCPCSVSSHWREQQQQTCPALQVQLQPHQRRWLELVVPMILEPLRCYRPDRTHGVSVSAQLTDRKQ